MTYNLHPIFVHFPIAMLFVYSLIKILPLKKWFPRVAWRQIERVLLVVGVLGAFAALATGDTAEHLVKPNHQLVDAHSTFAAVATWLYGALLLGEITAMVNVRLAAQKIVVLQFLECVLCHPLFSALLAFLALVAISITGLLGGVMAYGVTADPFANVVLKILGISL